MPYLPEECLKIVYLRHGFSKNRHFWSIYIEATNEIDFVVVNPVLKQRGGIGQADINLRTVFTQTLDDEGAEDIASFFTDWQVVNQHFVVELSEALKLIDGRLKEYKEKNKQATLLVL